MKEKDAIISFMDPNEPISFMDPNEPISFMDPDPATAPPKQAEPEPYKTPWDDMDWIKPTRGAGKTTSTPSGSPEARSQMTSGKPRGIAGKPTNHPLKLSEGMWDRDKVCHYVFDLIKSTTLTVDELFRCEQVYIDEGGVEWPLPNKRTFGKFLAEEPDLYKEFAAIKGLRGDLMADEALAVARDKTGDVMENIGDKSGKMIKTVNTANVARSRLLVDTLMRLAGIYNPKYQTKQQIEHSGEVGYTELRDKVCGEGAEDLASLKGQLGG